MTIARIIQSGAHIETRNGSLVRGIFMGEMDAQGQERRTPFHCYLDSSGRVINSPKVPKRRNQDHDNTLSRQLPLWSCALFIPGRTHHERYQVQLLHLLP